MNLKIAGTGPLEDTVLGYARKNRNIEYLGYRIGRELDDLILKSSFIIVPSECYENNPMTIIEAYSFGIPVIGSNLGGIPEVLHDNKTGFLFESRNGDDLERVITKAMKLEPRHYMKLSVNARRFSEQNFSTARHYEKLLEIYNEVAYNAQ